MLNPSFEQHCGVLGASLLLLPDKPQETAATTLKVLWLLAAGQALSIEMAEQAQLPELDAEAQAHLVTLMAQRLSGVPLAHLSGRQRFMGLEMLAGPEALIPRRETELLGETALEILGQLASDQAALRVLDVCTGSGNLALALAHHAPQARVFASDLSEQAVALAARNACHLGLEHRVEWRCGDLLEPFNEAAFHESVDLLVCNPPYISSRKVDTMAEEIRGFEPRLAFDGGPLGIRILERLIREAPRYLKKGGWLAFEVGQGQGAAVYKRLQANPAYVQQRSVVNAEGEIRMLLASR